MLYQRKNLATNTDIGSPAPLPPELVGLADISLADLSWVDPALGYTNIGFFPTGQEEPVTLTDRWVHKAIFKRRFTSAERIAIREAAKTDPILFDFNDIVDSTEKVYLDDPDMIQGLNYLVYKGLITAGRVPMILE